MSIRQEDVLHVARLAELAVVEEELPKLVDQMQRIVGYVDQLGGVSPSEQASPYLAGPEALALREDEVRPTALARSPSQLAPEFVQGFFVVPRLGAMEAE